MSWRLTERANARNYTDPLEKQAYRYAYNRGFSNEQLNFITDDFAVLYPNAVGAGYNDGAADREDKA